jgi:aspartate aminotransferase
MPKPLADRVAGLKPSATVEMTERVRMARASGRNIIGLSMKPSIVSSASAFEARGSP